MGTEIYIFKTKLFAEASFLHILDMSLAFRYLSIGNTYVKQITLTKWKCLRKKERKKKESCLTVHLHHEIK